MVCSCKNVPTSTAVKGDEEIQELSSAATNNSTSWRSSSSTFLEHMSVVSQGWTKARLLAHAGKPDVEDSSTWSYRWEEDRISGGLFEVQTFHFQDGAVASTEFGGGCVIRNIPNQE